MKRKYYSGFKSGRTPLEVDPVLPGCCDEEKRRAWKRQFEAGEITAAEYDEIRSSNLKPLRPTQNAPVVIIMNVRHGDMVVMHGADLQKYYEVRESFQLFFFSSLIDAARGGAERPGPFRTDNSLHRPRERRQRNGSCQGPVLLDPRASLRWQVIDHAHEPADH